LLVVETWVQGCHLTWSGAHMLVKRERQAAGRVNHRIAVSLLSLLAVGLIMLSLGLLFYYGIRLAVASSMPHLNPQRSDAAGKVESSASLVGDGLPLGGERRPTRRVAKTPQRWGGSQSAVSPSDRESVGETIGAVIRQEGGEVQDIELPPEVLLADVPVGKQTRNLNCEFQSASDLAWYYGKPYTWREIFLRVGHDPGGNPHKGFVGDSLDDPPGRLYPDGYGVYAEPVAQALRELGLVAQVHYRESAIWLKQQVAQGRPVMVWAMAGMREGQVEEWVAQDGTVIKGARGEHTYLVVGYTRDGARVIDPWYGERVFYSWETFLRSWDVFDRMSIVIEGTSDEQ